MSTTIIHRLNDWANEKPNAPAQKYKVKTKSGMDWKILTSKEYMEQVFYVALYLESCGVSPKDIGAILSYNCPEWVHMELALMLIRARSAGIYPNSTSKDIHYVLDHTKAVVLAVQNKDYFDKIVSKGGELPSTVRVLIVFDGNTSISPIAISFEKVLEEGKKLSKDKKISDYLARLDPKEASFMIYTSGTTGNPKGALLCQDNLAFTSDIVTARWKLSFETETLFSFLPLSHIAEKLHSIGVGISRRYLVTFCTKFEFVGKELPDAAPTLLLCVPRVWEKMMEGVVSKIEREKGAKAKLMNWAMGVGERVAKVKYEPFSLGSLIASAPDRAALPIADKLVLSKIRKALGLHEAKLLASGAAPLPAHVAKWFRILGLEIAECYGLTESTGVISLTLPNMECAGTVGKPLEGCEFKLGEDGEILSRGRHIFLGYLNDEANTADTLKEGWLHTGDLGAFTSEGLVKIIGRKKEIMKTSGGKMIAPVPIEEKLKMANFISQICLVGDNRKYLSALVTLSEGMLAELKENKSAFKDGILVDSKALGQVQAEFDRVNKTLASFEQIKKFTVLDREFSIEEGEMTPTLKMKRMVIEKRFKPLVDLMYSN